MGSQRNTITRGHLSLVPNTAPKPTRRLEVSNHAIELSNLSNAQLKAVFDPDTTTGPHPLEDHEGMSYIEQTLEPQELPRDLDQLYRQLTEVSLSVCEIFQGPSLAAGPWGISTPLSLSVQRQLQLADDVLLVRAVSFQKLTEALNKTTGNQFWRYIAAQF